VIDNFSRRILAFRVADRFDVGNAIAVLLDAARHAVASRKAGAPMVVVDGGVENFNERVDELIASGLLRRVLAQTEIAFSNSMIRGVLADDEAPVVVPEHARHVGCVAAARDVLRGGAQRPDPALGVPGTNAGRDVLRPWRRGAREVGGSATAGGGTPAGAEPGDVVRGMLGVGESECRGRVDAGRSEGGKPGSNTARQGFATPSGPPTTLCPA